MVTALVASRDYEWVASGSKDGKIILSNVVDPSTWEEWYAGDHTITGLAFSPDNKRLASAHKNGRVKVWNIRLYGPERAHLGRFAGASNRCTRPIRAVVWAPDGERIAAVSSSCLYICRLDQDSTLLKYDHEVDSTDYAPIAFARFSPNNRLLVYGGAAGLIRVWSSEDCATRIECPHDMREAVRHVDFDAQGGHIVVCFGDGTMRVYAVDHSGLGTFTLLTQFAKPGTCVEHAAFLPEGGLMMVVSKDGEMFIRKSHGPPTYHFGRRLWLGGSSGIGQVKSVHFSRTGRLVAIVSKEDAVCVWQTSTVSEELELSATGSPSLGLPMIDLKEDPTKVPRLAVFGRDGRIFVS